MKLIQGKSSVIPMIAAFVVAEMQLRNKGPFCWLID
jgi:hypothetical protein